MRRRCLLAFLTLALTLTLTQAADWARFRGPNGTGVADGPLPPVDPKNPLWKVAIPGKGNGSPIVVKGKVFLQTASADGAKRSLVCLDAASGKTLWAKDVPGSKASTHAANSLASSTPASDGESVYCVFWDGAAVAVHAFGLDGTEKWSQSLGSYSSEHGAGHSPMVHNGKVFVNFDQDAADKKGKVTTDKPAVVVALDAKTGNRVWEKTRDAVRASYTTPFLLEQPGKPAELIVGTTSGIDSYDPDTGKVNWHYTIEWATPKKLRMIGCPVFAGGVLVFYTGEGGDDRYMVALRPGGAGDVTKTARAWEVRQLTPYVPSLLTKNDLLFWMHDNGRAVCAEAKTGKLLWDGKDTPVTGKVFASPILAGDEILVIGEKGTAVVLRADKEYSTSKKVEFGETVYATPAMADGRLYVRTSGHLYCFGKK